MLLVAATAALAGWSASAIRAADPSDVTVSLSGPTSGAVGDVLTFALTVGNNGPGTAGRASAYVAINTTQFEFVQATGGCFLSEPTPDWFHVFCDAGDLAAGSTAGGTFSLRVVQINENHAIVASAYGGSDTNTQNNEARVVLWPRTPPPPPPLFPPQPVINTTALPPARVGDAYSAQINLSGGSPPYDVEPNGGFIPPGLSLSTNGVVSGTPTAPGDFVIWIRVQDQFYKMPDPGPGAVGSMTIHVDLPFGDTGNGPARLATVDPTLPAATAGQPIDMPLLSNGTRPPFKLTLTLGRLPDGVRFRASDAHLVGSPAEAGLFVFVAYIADAADSSVQSTLRWRIANAPVPTLYKSCKQLNGRYRHGVGKVGARDHTSGRRVTTFTRSNKLYASAIRWNKALDGDKDGIACEHA
jgi:uncharacterized protein DUF11/putative Ig domain-containing protein/excalibur calcium-binding domain-containing protein